KIGSEVDAGQRLIEIVDVEQDVLLWGSECPKIHQMTIAASLDRNPRSWLVPEILGHDGGSTAQKCEWASQHALVTNRHQLGHSGAVGRCENSDRVAFHWFEQIRVLLAQTLLAQSYPVLVAFGQRTGRCLGHGGLSDQVSAAATCSQISRASICVSNFVVVNPNRGMGVG